MTVQDKQYWVRNEQRRTWGPYEMGALERLRGMINPSWQVSLDGTNFQPISDFPEMNDLATAPKRAAPPPIQAPEKIAPDEQEARDAARRAARAAVEQMRLARETSTGKSPSSAGSPAGRPIITPPSGAAPTSPRSPSSAASPTPAGGPPIMTPAGGVAAGGPQSASALSREGSASNAAASSTPLEILDEGDLEVSSPIRLYAIAAVTSASGWLQLEATPGSMLQISFRRGSPEHLESTDPELSLLAFLRKTGTLSSPQAQAAVAHTQKARVDLVTALFQLQLIPPTDAHRLLKEHMLSLLDRALMMWRGRFSFERDAPSPPGAFPLGQRWSLLAESIRRLDVKPLRARLGLRLQAPVVRSGGLALGKVEELSLTAQEARLYAAIDGTRTGEELLRDSPDGSPTLRILFLLSELGHISFAMDKRPATPEASAVESSSPARSPTDPALPTVPRAGTQQPIIAPAASARRLGAFPGLSQASPAAGSARVPPSVGLRAVGKGVVPRGGGTEYIPVTTFVTGPPGEDLDLAVVRLAGIHTRIADLDHFAALGLERKATKEEIKKLFIHLARELHPDTVQDGNPELREVKSRLFARVNEAVQTLTDDKRRKEYEDEMDGKGPVDVARIFAAEQAFTRGEIMIKARKFPEGLELIEEAIELNPQEGEFYAWRGWAKFVLAKDRKSQYPLSFEECKKALSMLDKCAPAWLFLGNMQKAMGELIGAEKSYRSVLEIEPRHVDAMRELRAMGKKYEPPRDDY